MTGDIGSIVAAARMRSRPSAMSLAGGAFSTVLPGRISASLVSEAASDPFLASTLADRPSDGRREPELTLAPSAAGVYATAMAHPPAGLVQEIAELLETHGLDSSSLASGGWDVAVASSAAHVWLMAHASATAQFGDAVLYGHDATVALSRILARAAGDPAGGPSRLQDMPRIPRYLKVSRGPAADPLIRDLAPAVRDSFPMMWALAAAAGVDPNRIDRRMFLEHVLSDLTGGSAGGSAVVRAASLAPQFS